VLREWWLIVDSEGEGEVLVARVDDGQYNVINSFR
jgi:hypothetical protein